MTEYSYCRSDSTRRKTLNNVTKTEPCEKNWDKYVLEFQAADGRCGCATCEYKYICPSNNCGPRDDFMLTKNCDFQLCKEPSRSCETQNQYTISNSSSYDMYVIYSKTGFWAHYLIPSSQSVSGFFKSDVYSYVRAGIVGQLNSSSIFTATLAYPDIIHEQIPKITTTITRNVRCIHIDFVDSFIPCEEVIVASPETDLLEPVQRDLNIFLSKMTLSQINKFLDKATIYFVSGDQYFEPNITKDSFKGFALQSGQTPTELTWNTLSNNQFEMQTKNGTKVQVCQRPGECSTTFILSFQQNATQSNSLLQTNVSLFPLIDANLNTIMGFELLLPFETNFLYPGLDNVRMIIKSLGVESRNAFLDSSNEAKKQCCDVNIFSKYGFAVCNSSKYSRATGGNYIECDAFADQFCEDSKNAQENKIFCSCYPNAPIDDPLQEQILKTLKEKNINLPRKCLVSACKIGKGYKNAAMIQEECVGLCLQIQNIITKGELSNIKFSGRQTLQCGDQTLTFSEKATKLGILLFSVAGVILLIGIIVLPLLKKFKIPTMTNLIYILPISIAIILVTLGLLVFYQVF